jgi:exonuclease III
VAPPSDSLGNNCNNSVEPRFINCCLINARSLKNKLNDLHEFIYSERPDILCVTETWLNASVSDSLIVQDTGYGVCRQDRQHTEGGGVCILYNTNSVNAAPVPIPAKFLNCEIVALDIIGSDFNVRIITCYRPPSSDTDPHAVHSLGSHILCLEYLSNVESSIVICGDFNFPHINWDLTPPSSLHSSISDLASCSSTFLDFFHQQALTQFVGSVTHPSLINPGAGSTLDLVMCNDSFLIHDVVVNMPFSTSDHCAVDFKLLNLQPVNPMAASFRDFKNADWSAIDSFFCLVDFDSLFVNFTDISTAFDNFYAILNDCIDRFVPLKVIDNGRCLDRKTYTAAIRKLLVKKKTSWQLYKQFRTPESLLKFKQLSSQCRQAISTFTLHRENIILQSANLGKFYRMANSKFNTKTAVGPLKNDDGSFVTSPTEKSNLFQNFFSSIANLDNGTLPNTQQPKPSPSQPILIRFTPYLVKRVLDGLNIKAKGGPDNIPPIFLKACSNYLSRPLSSLFQLSFDLAFMPPIWLMAYITPIFKKGDRSNPKNYRPIALTCSICKIMESIIKNVMLTQLQSHGVITKHQHAFLSRHSTATNLLESTHDWAVSMSHRKSVDVIYVDFSRAFDSIVHRKLMYKLTACGIGGSLLKWIETFLSGRSQCVVLENCHSIWGPVLSGVPQGSVLGPLLFILFINDIGFICAANISFKLYADDLKIYSEATIDDSTLSLQQSLDNLTSWATDWQLPINISKCAVLSLGSHSDIPPHPYSINNFLLSHVDTISDLGVTMDQSLSYSNHINSMVARANSRVGLLFRAFQTRHPFFLKQAYITYIRPILEYCSIIWNPCLKKFVNAIENVQRHFTKRIPALSNLSYHERLAFLELDPLELRRLKTDLAQYYLIFHNQSAVQFLDHFQLCAFNSNTRSTNTARLLKNVSGPGYLYNHFFNRAIDSWNSLPISIINSPSVTSFKSRLCKVDLSQYLVGRIFD